ncbi:MAG TPA: 30S ribosomal protein S4 [Candidatus Paceibacterota bacterium]|nr:30S ribosomal protein S4 [Candidatus Paceibacterota bacterium]HMP18753.1 30S ribosomal protein S4 [Candidatus Paceibacterota bacterium]HMP85314.1 30S ribosomal protein S4 [Candidatus Paceibacterota bacterium]
MKVGPKYKIAKRLGAAVFEKTQSQKFILRAEKKGYSTTGVHGKTNFGTQVLEKQKVRYTYGISATQLSNYVKSIVRSKIKQPEAKLFELLERRLDNVVLRSGLATTRFQARQIVTHGHMKVNGKKTTVPSFQVKKGDVVTVKESNRNKPLFATFKDKEKDMTPPSWINVDNKNYTITVLADPQYKPTELAFNLGNVVQFYKR